MKQEILEQLKRHLESVASRREQVFKRQLEKTVEVLARTRHAFRSKQLKELREEIESVLASQQADK